MTTGVGFFEIAINGKYFRKEWTKGWTLNQYANHFRDAIKNQFPTFEVTVDDTTAELTVTSEAGEALEVLVNYSTVTGEYKYEGFLPENRMGQYECMYRGVLVSVPWTGYEQDLEIVGDILCRQIEAQFDLFSATRDSNGTWALTYTTKEFKPHNIIVTTPEGKRENAPVVLQFFTEDMKKVEGSMTLDVSSSEAVIPPPVFVVIKNGVAEQTYELSLDGQRVSYSTGSTDAPATYRSDTIANALAERVNFLGQYAAEVFYNVIVITRNDGADILFDYFDTWGNQALYAMKGRVAAIEDLPSRFLDGFPIEVVGVNSDSGGYYLHWTHGDGFEIEDKGSLKTYVEREYERKGGVKLAEMLMAARRKRFGYSEGVAWIAQESEQNGIYKETRKSYIPHVIVPETMPHALVREADGTFTFKTLDWADRKVGNEKSCPRPSFIGRRISDMFFFKNRFGLLTNESVVLSRAGEFFNFWPVSAKDVLDSDPIDIMVSHTEVSILRHAIPFDDKMVLFADRTQFALTSQGALTPRTVNLLPSTMFNADKNVKPVTSGQNVFFASERSGFTQVREYFVAPQQTQATADDISAHCPRYIRGNAFKMAVSSTEDVLMVLTASDPSAVYVYKYLWNGEEKVQNSWSRWFTKNGTILSVSFIDSTAYAVVSRPGGVFLERMELKMLNQDGAVPFGVYLDRKVEVTGVNVGDTTVFTLPFDDAREATFVKSFGLAPEGAELEVTKTGPSTYSVPGNYGGTKAIAGFPYEMRYRFSPVFIRDGQGQAVVDAKLKLKTFSVAYANTGEFSWKVTPLLRSTQVKPFKANIPGVNSGTPELATLGTYRTQVLSDAQTVQIELSHTAYTPCQFQSATWEGIFTTRARKL